MLLCGHTNDTFVDVPWPVVAALANWSVTVAETINDLK
jgi:hypothetical protein